MTEKEKRNITISEVIRDKWMEMLGFVAGAEEEIDTFFKKLRRGAEGEKDEVVTIVRELMFKKKVATEGIERWIDESAQRFIDAHCFPLWEEIRRLSKTLDSLETRVNELRAKRGLKVGGRGKGSATGNAKRTPRARTAKKKSKKTPGRDPS